MNDNSEILTSEDGINWNKTDFFLEDYAPYGSVYEVKLLYLQGFFYLYNCKGVFLCSTDGQVLEDISFRDRKVCDLVYDGEAFFAAVGSTEMGSGSIGSDGPTKIYRSENGMDWEVLIDSAKTQGAAWITVDESRILLKDLIQNAVYFYDKNGQYLSASSELHS